MGDESKGGGDASFYINDVLLYKYGQWSSSISKASFNFRELRNLVEAIEEHVRKGKLRDCEVLLLTNNLVEVNAFYKGSSSSKTLFNPIIRLMKL